MQFIIASFIVTIFCSNLTANALAQTNSTIIPGGGSVSETHSGNTTAIGPVPITSPPAPSPPPPPKQIINTLNRTLVSHIAQTGSNIYILGEKLGVSFCNDSTGYYCEYAHRIFLKRSNDNGSRFEHEQVLASNVASPLSVAPQLSASGNNVYVAWTENNYTANPRTYIEFTKSIDNGATFAQPNALMLVNGSVGPSVLQRIVSDGNTVLILFLFGSNTYVITSHDSGEHFDPPIQIGNGQVGASAIISGSDVYVVWIYDPNIGSPMFDFLHQNQPSSILYMISTDEGRTYSNQITLGNTTFKNRGAFYDPQVFASMNSSNVYVTWQDLCDDQCHKVYFAKSHDGGKTFENSTILSSVEENYVSSSAGLKSSLSGNNLCLGWIDSYNETSGRIDMAFVLSNDSGTSFSPKNTISIEAATRMLGVVNTPFSLDLEGSNVLLTWIGEGKDIQQGVSETLGQRVLLQRSNNCGHTFASTALLDSRGTTFLLNSVPLTEESYSNATYRFISQPTNVPLISQSNGIVFIIWQGNAQNNNDVLYSISTDGGQTFQKPVSFNLVTVPEFGLMITLLVLLIGMGAVASIFRKVR